MSISTRRFGSGGALGRVAALMALFAMIGVLALSTWHDGMPHSHAAVHATSVDRDHHEHAPSKTPDMADVLHMAAHAVIQTYYPPKGVKSPVANPSQVMLVSILRATAGR